MVLRIPVVPRKWERSGCITSIELRLKLIKLNGQVGRLAVNRLEASIVEDFRLSPPFPELLLFSSKSFP